MRYHVRLEGREEPLIVRILSDDGERVDVEVDGEAVSFGLADLGGGRLFVERGGSLDRIDVLGRGSLELLHGAESFRATVVDERDTWLGSGHGLDASGSVTVAMPGKVVAIDASEGDAVKKGDRLLVIEAMKMENDVKSPRDGVVVSILVAPGDAVEAGQVLIELE